MLCIGPTGTGKTLAIADKLTKSMPKDFIPEFITFSAKTSANQTQDLIDGKLDKRYGIVGVYPGEPGPICLSVCVFVWLVVFLFVSSTLSLPCFW